MPSFLFPLFKAMGINTDKELIHLVCGKDKTFMDLFLPSLDVVSKENISTVRDALDYLGTRCKPPLRPNFVPWAPRKPGWEEAKELLSTMVLAHIPTEGPCATSSTNPEKEVPLLNLRPKAVYCAVMIRRVLQAVKDGYLVDDRDFVGNKRLEL